MKKLRLMFLLMFMFLFVGCGEVVEDIEFTFTFDENYIYVTAGEQYKLNFNINNIDNPNIEYEYTEEGIINIENCVINGLAEGEVIVTASITNGSLTKEVIFTVNVERPDPESIEVMETLEIVLGETYQLEWKIFPEFASQEVEFNYLSRNVLLISDTGLVTTLGLGQTSVMITSTEDSSIRASLEIFVIRPTVENIKTDNNIAINHNESKKLNYEVLPENSLPDVTFESMNTKIVSVDEEGNIFGVCPGSTTVTITSVGNKEVVAEINVTVKGVLATDLIVEDNIEVNLGEEYLIAYDIIGDGAHQVIDFVGYDESAIEINEDGLLIAKKSGEYLIKAITIDGSNIEKSIKVKASGSSLPTFVFYNCTQDDVISLRSNFEALEGVRVFDSEDGEITELKIDGAVDTKKYGTYILTYTAIDSDNNKVVITRNIEVKWNYAVQFIGHAGSYFGLQNSEEAILYAITELNYTCVEIDLKQTKDGVFVLCHDDEFGDYDIARTNWDTLKDYKITGTRNAGYPKSEGLIENGGKYTAGLCTLERFLEICKEYSVTPVIELKWSNGINNDSQSRMGALMNEIKKADMLDNVIFLASAYKCLIWLRNNGYEDIPCQYLVNSCENETYLQRCIQYNFDISINATGNYINGMEWIQKYKDAGCKVSTFTFSQYVDYDTVQAWIDRGVDFVTCDWHHIDELDLPEL